LLCHTAKISIFLRKQPHEKNIYSQLSHFFFLLIWLLITIFKQQLNWVKNKFSIQKKLPLEKLSAQKKE